MEEWWNLSRCVEESMESGLDDFDSMYRCKGPSWVSRTGFSSQYWCWYSPSTLWLTSKRIYCVAGINWAMTIWSGCTLTCLQSHEVLGRECTGNKVWFRLIGETVLWIRYVALSPFVPRDMIKLYLSIHWKCQIKPVLTETITADRISHPRFSISQKIGLMKVAYWESQVDAH